MSCWSQSHECRARRRLRNSRVSSRVSCSCANSAKRPPRSSSAAAPTRAASSHLCTRCLASRLERPLPPLLLAPPSLPPTRLRNSNRCLIWRRRRLRLPPLVWASFPEPRTGRVVSDLRPAVLTDMNAVAANQPFIYQYIFSVPCVSSDYRAPSIVPLRVYCCLITSFRACEQPVLRDHHITSEQNKPLPLTVSLPTIHSVNDI